MTSKISRGTNPTLVISIPGLVELNPKQVVLSIQQGTYCYNYSYSELEIIGDNVVKHFTQEETLQLEAGCHPMQVRLLTDDGLALKSEMLQLDVESVLYDNVITKDASFDGPVLAAETIVSTSKEDQVISVSASTYEFEVMIDPKNEYYLTVNVPKASTTSTSHVLTKMAYSAWNPFYAGYNTFNEITNHDSEIKLSAFTASLRNLLGTNYLDGKFKFRLVFDIADSEIISNLLIEVVKYTEDGVIAIETETNAISIEANEEESSDEVMVNSAEEEDEANEIIEEESIDDMDPELADDYVEVEEEIEFDDDEPLPDDYELTITLDDDDIQLESLEYGEPDEMFEYESEDDDQEFDIE